MHTDAIEARIVAGQWAVPHAGDTLAGPDGTERTWKAITADKDGRLADTALEGGYADITVDSPTECVRLLAASAHSAVYVNGELRPGDPYETGGVKVPIALHAGRNELLFACGRGHLQARLIVPKAGAVLDAGDTTLPDLVVGQRARTLGALPVLNATREVRGDLVLSAAIGSARPTLTPVPALGPLTTRKVGFALEGPALTIGDSVPLHVRLLRRAGGRMSELDHLDLKLRLRRPDQTTMRTFVSGIDGSVQYYAVNPATPARPGAPPSALVLTLHGAGVQAIGQADAYESKPWATLVAPTNRRPFGFDWEDWGRDDALEVLALAQSELHVDTRRTYLAGHSMGGHGTWQVGVTYPDRFAAIGPSAGWISFTSYIGGKAKPDPSPVAAMLRRAANQSDTLQMGHNLTQEGVYILHGSADDNVPVTEARAMSQYLSGFHHDFTYFEQPGAGHWWDVSPEPGADCVDWAPMYDFFARHTLPDEASVRQVDFTTVNPGVSARDHWATIWTQLHSLQPSTISIRFDPGLRRFIGTTTNVARLRFDLDTLRPSGPMQVELDGQKIEKIDLPPSHAAQPGALWLERNGDRWAVASAPSDAVKGPERAGPFKTAFRNRMVLVYGTRGTAEENAWAYAKARYDAETFWVRGNGSIDVVPDTAFETSTSSDSGRGHSENAGPTDHLPARPASDRDRSVILYGNADTNGAWAALLGDSPVQVHRGLVTVGGRRLMGNSLACLFLRPRSGRAWATVGVVSGSGLPGMRLTERLPYFVSGVAYPDVTVLSTEVLQKGEAGVLGAGFFGPDWSVETGDFAWNEPQQLTEK